MPKSKSKRKLRKKKAWASFPLKRKKHSSLEQGVVEQPVNRTNILLSLITGNDAVLIYRIVFASPLFVGAIVAKNSLVLEPKLFLLFLLMLAISSFWFRHFSEFSSVKHLLTFVALLCLHMAIFSVLGIYSQFQELSIATAVLGLMPGFLLGAALIAKHGSLFDLAGFKRITVHVSKKGIESKRPGGASRIFTIFLMLFPGLVIIAGIFSILPIYFLLVAVVLLRTPNLAQGFQDRTIADRAIYLAAMRLALLATVLMLVAGLLSSA